MNFAAVAGEGCKRQDIQVSLFQFERQIYKVWMIDFDSWNEGILISEDEMLPSLVQKKPHKDLTQHNLNSIIGLRGDRSPKVDIRNIFL